MRRIVGDAVIALFLIACGLVVYAGFTGAIVGGGALLACVGGLALVRLLRPEPLTGAQYRFVSIPPREAVADDTSLIAAAKVVFARWIDGSPLHNFGYRDVRASVQRRCVGRLETKLGGRGFVWHSISYAGPERPKGSRIDTSMLDVNMLPRELRTLSRYIATCRVCDGDGAVRCLSCGGSKRVQCPTCHGEGNPDRLVNCVTCHGLGSVACEGARCKGGNLVCELCQGTGKLEEWLTVEGGTRNADVQIEPEGELTRPFHWGKDGAFATQEAIEEDARVVATVTQERPLDYDELPKEPDWGGRDSWKRMQPKLQGDEAIGAQTFMLIEIVTVEVVFGLWSVVLFGRRLLAPIVSPRAMQTRAPVRLQLALAALPLAIIGAYLPRSEYFASTLTVLVVLGAALFAAATYAVFAARDPIVLALAALGALVAGGAALRIAAWQEPSVAAVRALLAAKDAEAASWQLHALGYPDDVSLKPLADDVQAVRALKEVGCKRVLGWLEDVTTDSPLVREARAFADREALREAEVTPNRPAYASDILAAIACASREAQASPRMRELRAAVNRTIASGILAAGEECLNWRQVECALENAKRANALGAESSLRRRALVELRREIDEEVDSTRTFKSPDLRAASARRAIALWTFYLTHEPGPEPKTMTALKEQLARDEQLIAAAEREREHKRAVEADKKARAEAERKAKVEAADRKRREEEAKFPPDASVKCCDGTLSPTCTCGGPRAGCCERHGGVCGCQ
jgi:hypothetical protein